jgi:acetoin utilization deacetylase AcuC-like enzyme
MRMRPVHVYTHDDCLLHEPGTQHPECPDRLRAIRASLHGSGTPHAWTLLDAPLGTDAQVLLAHTAPYLARVKARNPLEGTVALDPDTMLSPGSLHAALRGVGAACAGVDALMQDECEHAFVLTRPPGHHATPDQAMGFCIFNHSAIAALHAQKQWGLERIVIVDFDVHHGNGTQDILRGRKGLHYISTHQSPLYPGTGWEDENVAGNISNFPLPAGLSGKEYEDLFTTEVLPQLHASQPQLLLVSAGFDAHVRDPLASLGLTEETYFWLGRQLRAVADEYAQGRLLSVLEGGYNLEVLGGSAEAYLSGSLQASVHTEKSNTRSG